MTQENKEKWIKKLHEDRNLAVQNFIKHNFDDFKDADEIKRIEKAFLDGFDQGLMFANDFMNQII